MSVAEKIVNKICDKYAKFREENYDLPSYLVLSIEARQAIKVMAHHPEVAPLIELKEYLGIPVISKEKVIIV